MKLVRKKLKSWIKIALPYILTALVPLVSVFFLGSMISKRYQDERISEKQTQLEAACSRLTQNLDTVESLSYMISRNNIVNQYSISCLTHSGHDAVQCMEVKKLFSTVMLNPVVKEIYLFDSMDDQVISSTGAVSDTEMFFRYSYDIVSLTEKESVERLEKMSLRQFYLPAVQVSIGGSLKKIIEYRTFIPVGWIKNMQSQLVISIGVSELLGDFDNLTDGGELYVYDDNGVLLYSKGSTCESMLGSEYDPKLKKINAAGTEMYGAVLGGNGGWKVKVFIPRSSIASGTSAPFYVWAIMILSIIASIFLSIYFTHKHHTQIRSILEVFGKNSENSFEITFTDALLDYNTVREYAKSIVKAYEQLISSTADAYYYPHSCDEKISSYITVGNVTEAKRILLLIYEDNYLSSERKISGEASLRLKNRIRECMESLAAQYDVPVEFIEEKIKEEYCAGALEGKEPEKIYFDALCNIADTLSREIQKKLETVEKNTAEKIHDYVENNYCDNMLSLKEISGAFCIHENYISALFKKTYGENLSSYIEQLRIEKACELIRNTEMQIRDIALEVGYTSDASFRRAFKKVKGESPGMYRESKIS